MAARDPNKLTPRERRFVLEYLKDFNATRAAVRAGYSQRSAAEIGYENLRKPRIAAAVEEAAEDLLAQAGVTVGRIIREYARIAFADLGELVTWDDEGRVDWTARGDLPEGFTAALAEFTEKVTIIPQRAPKGEDPPEPIERREVKAKFHDKLHALDKLLEFKQAALKGGGDADHDADLDEIDAREALVPPP